jgi:membrane-bound serine protease (ClpP class)
MHEGTRRAAQLALRLPAVLFALIGLALVAGPAAEAAPRRFVDVAQVSGWIDPVVADFVERTIADAEQEEPEALVLQIDSPGALVDDARLDELVRSIERATVPVAVWVGDSGARASGDAGRLVDAADIAGMAPRTKVDVDGRTYGTKEALEAGVVDMNQEEAAVLGTFIAALDGKTVDGHELDTADFTPQKTGPPKAQLNVQVKLAKLDLWPRLMHTFASPPVAYLLFLAGLVLLIFELFTGGVGIAGGVGVLALVLGSYGLAVLPTNPWAVALLVLAMFGFAVDVQTGVPRFWTGVGVVALVIGSLVLYTDDVRLSWLTLLAGVVGVLLMVLGGLPATVRSRYSTPTIGRESMVGEVGEAVADVRPDGVVRVRGALWPAHTSRATPLLAGQPVRVVAVDGPQLQVEPVESP